MMMDSGNFGEEPKIVLDETGQAYMLETARWSKFLGIVTCVMLGIILLLFPLMLRMNPAYQTVASNGFSTVVSIFYIVVIAGIYVYPLYALIQFSNKVKPAIREVNQHKFNEALRLLKNLYRYIGILTIILLFIYGIFIVFALTIAVTSSI